MKIAALIRQSALPALPLLLCSQLAAAQADAEQALEVDDLFDTVFRVANFNLFLVEGQPVTPFKLFLALVVFLVGLRVVRRVSELAGRRLVARTSLDANARHLAVSIIHYSLAALVLLFAIDLAGIPLTVFAFLGGAVAIALGFGGQEILANFMGGFILMVEKPIKIGDLIEYDGCRGKVLSVGARSTKLEMPGNVHLVVPNKDLLGNKLINWNFTDDLVASEITVGVAYGSPTGAVRELLAQAVDEHSGIEKSQKCVVLFEDFGDNALIFRVVFWTRVSNFMQRRQIESDVRFRIDELCRERGVTIAFPQRDVHLDTLRPLEIRLRRDGEPAASGGE